MIAGLLIIVGVLLLACMRCWMALGETKAKLDLLELENIDLHEQLEIAARPILDRDALLERMRDGKL